MTTFSSVSDIAVTISAERIEHAANILKNIAHPTRIAVIDLLRQCRSMTVSELQEKLCIQDQALISHHLTTMRDRGILICTKSGRNSFYSLQDESVLAILDCIKAHGKH